MNFKKKIINSKTKIDQELNAESKKILEESRKGLNINKYSSYNDMYKKLKLIK